jgi:hypothetical protein
MRAGGLARRGQARRLGDPEQKSFTRAAARAPELDRLDRRYEDLEARLSDVCITHEARVYGPHSEFSYFLDRAAIATGSELGGAVNPTAARERMADYGRELRWHLAARDPEGRRAESVLREASRLEDREQHRKRFTELRATGTGGGSSASAGGSEGGAFVSPFFILEQYALFRGRWRAFADQCHSQPLPPTGFRCMYHAGAAPQVSRLKLVRTQG